MLWRLAAFDKSGGYRRRGEGAGRPILHERQNPLVPQAFRRAVSRNSPPQHDISFRGTASSVSGGGSGGQRFSDRGLFSCAIPPWQSHVINLDGTRRHRCLVQSKIVVTRPPPEEPTVRTALTVATRYTCIACN